MSASLIGRKITKVRRMSPDELRREGWSIGSRSAPVAVELDDGSVLYASEDDEGNGPGALFGVERGQSFQVRVG